MNNVNLAKDIKLLIIEDEAKQIKLLQIYLNTAESQKFRLKSVQRLHDGIFQAKTESFDLIILDLTLPDSHGLSSLISLKQQVPDVPIVVLSNTNDHELAVQAVRLGAQDYLIKSQVTPASLTQSLRYAIERNRASEKLLQTEESQQAHFSQERRSLLLVEDDANLAQRLEREFLLEGYEVDRMEDGESAWQQLQIMDYDLILLDVMLPKLDGMALCKRLRSHNIQTMVLMLTVLSNLEDQVMGLEAGADDYLVKPINFSLLMARIRALLRRNTTVLPTVLRWGALRLNPHNNTVTHQNSAISLTPKEFAILEKLMQCQGQVLTYAKVSEHIWPYDHPPSQEVVRVHIQMLRRKIKAAGGPEDLIQTVHGVGYCLAYQADFSC